MKKIDLLRKCLLYQSQHRGMKEMDIILGGFAQKSLKTMTYKELQQFEALLDFPDQELYGWLFEKTAIPEDAPQNLVEMLYDFVNNP